MNNNKMGNDDRLIIPQSNTYINQTTTETNINTNPNTPKPPIDYSQDPTVQKNLQKKSAASFQLSSDGLVFIIIALILLVVIYFLPAIYSFIN